MKNPVFMRLSMISVKIQGFYFKAADGNRTCEHKAKNTVFMRPRHFPWCKRGAWFQNAC